MRNILEIAFATENTSIKTHFPPGVAIYPRNQHTGRTEVIEWEAIASAYRWGEEKETAGENFSRNDIRETERRSAGAETEESRREMAASGRLLCRATICKLQRCTPRGARVQIYVHSRGERGKRRVKPVCVERIDGGANPFSTSHEYRNEGQNIWIYVRAACVFLSLISAGKVIVLQVVNGIIFHRQCSRSFPMLPAAGQVARKRERERETDEWICLSCVCDESVDEDVRCSWDKSTKYDMCTYT